jgi:hypothetical protein
MSELKVVATRTVAQTAVALNVSEAMIYKLMKTGKLARLEIGRRKLPLVDSINELAKKNTVTEVAVQPTSTNKDRRKRDWSVFLDA